jgi:putative ABC transport system ATP-binding protein
MSAAPARPEPMVRCEGLVHIYRSDGLEVVALQGLDLSVDEGEMVAIVGRSGSGKTTLMNVLAGLDAPSAGVVRVAGWDVTRLDEGGRAAYRERVVGYVWQRAHTSLAAELDAVQNVQLPMVAARRPWDQRHARARELLVAIGLGDRLHHRPGHLSAGEQQRVALAVALANGPSVLLADEPTAQLDGATARAMLADLRGVQRDLGLTAVIVTHDPQVARHVDRVVRIRDGRTSSETRWVAERGGDRPDELVIMDRAGRLQVPPALLAATGLAGRVRVLRHGRGVLILPADGPAEGSADAGEGPPAGG